MNSRRIYVASSWRNQHQPRVVGLLRELGHEVYDFLNPEPGNAGFRWLDVFPNWAAMGVEWMGREYTEAIPPAYAEYIARQLTPALLAEAAA